jgi:DNA-binding transcriptional LysR family regulator
VRHRCINYRLVASTLYAWAFERNGKALEMLTPGPLTFNDPTLILYCALDGLSVAYVLEHEAVRYVQDGRRGGYQRIGHRRSRSPSFPSRRQMQPILAAFSAAVRGREV